MKTYVIEQVQWTWNSVDAENKEEAMAKFNTGEGVDFDVDCVKWKYNTSTLRVDDGTTQTTGTVWSEE
tara:strand:+ start:733 stop:936 length:204 start_codon:yes stop_codon:yes gene_type:complete